MTLRAISFFFVLFCCVYAPPTGQQDNRLVLVVFRRSGDVECRGSSLCIFPLHVPPLRHISRSSTPCLRRGRGPFTVTECNACLGCGRHTSKRNPVWRPHTRPQLQSEVANRELHLLGFCRVSCQCTRAFMMIADNPTLEPSCSTELLSRGPVQSCNASMQVTYGTAPHPQQQLTTGGTSGTQSKSTKHINQDVLLCAAMEYLCKLPTNVVMYFL